MDEEDRFLRVIAARPNDEGARADYAAWLAAQSTAMAGHKHNFLLLGARIRALSSTDPELPALTGQMRAAAEVLDPDWRALVGWAPVENCGIRFELVCPKSWAAFAPTDKPGVRFCDTCKRNVHYVKTAEEAYAHAARRECVAIDPVGRAELRVPLMPSDMPMPPPTAGVPAMPPKR